MIELCNVQYRRPVRLYPSAQVLFCQYIAGHPNTRHSFHAVETSDASDLQDLIVQHANVRDDSAPAGVQAFLDSINRGDMDAYLEALLAASHSRKRALRGVRFPYGIFEIQ